MILPFLIGCDYIPLTQEQQASVDGAYVSAGLEKDTVTALGAAADSIYGASAMGNAAFSADHEQSYTLLQQFYEEDKIKGFDPIQHPDFEDSSAVLMRNIFGAPTYIGVNIETYTDLTSDELMHESGHSLQNGHDPSLEALLDTGAFIYDKETAEKVLDVQDFPYLLSYLYVTADTSLYYNHNYPPAANETKEEWAEKVSALYDHLPFLPLLEITQEEYETILVQSNFYDLLENL